MYVSTVYRGKQFVPEPCDLTFSIFTSRLFHMFYRLIKGFLRTRGIGQREELAKFLEPYRQIYHMFSWKNSTYLYTDRCRLYNLGRSRKNLSRPSCKLKSSRLQLATKKQSYAGTLFRQEDHAS